MCTHPVWSEAPARRAWRPPGAAPPYAHPGVRMVAAGGVPTGALPPPPALPPMAAVAAHQQQQHMQEHMQEHTQEQQQQQQNRKRKLTPEEKQQQKVIKEVKKHEEAVAKRNCANYEIKGFGTIVRRDRPDEKVNQAQAIKMILDGSTEGDPHCQVLHSVLKMLDVV